MLPGQSDGEPDREWIVLLEFDGPDLVTDRPECRFTWYRHVFAPTAAAAAAKYQGEQLLVDGYTKRWLSVFPAATPHREVWV